MPFEFIVSIMKNLAWRAHLARIRVWRFLCVAGFALSASLLLSGCLSILSDEKPSPEEIKVLPEAARSAEQRGQYGAAANIYRKMYLESPSGLSTLLGYARNLRYAGATSEAVTLLEDAEERAEENYESSSDYLLELGKARLAAGRGDAAVLTLLRAAKLDGKNWEIHSALGIGYDMLKEYGRADRAYRRALSLSPKNPTVLNNMAMSLAQYGKIDEAIKVLESVPNLTRAKAHIRQNLALFYGIKGNFKKAKSYAKLDLDDATVKNNMAYFRQFQGKRVTK
jgi:Flp pilus assembly protein TadD